MAVMRERVFDEEPGVTRKVIGFAMVGAMVIAAFVVIAALLGSWYTIDQRERGVILRNGQMIGTATPGLNFKWPFIDSVVRISLENFVLTYPNLSTYSRDQQEAHISVAVNVRAMESQVGALYTDYGGIQGFIDRRVTPKMNEELKTVFGTFNAVTAIQQRGKLNADVRSAIVKGIEAGGGNYVTIADVQITNIDFSKAYQASIEARMLAEVEVQRVLQNVEREKATAQITVTKAQAHADSTLAQAKAEADAIRLRGDAEAAAIRARGESLALNPRLVDLVQAEKWNGSMPTSLMMPPNGSAPLLAISPRP